jgi:hypothetical protein
MFVYLGAEVWWIVSFWAHEPARKPLSPKLQEYLIDLHRRVQYDLASAHWRSFFVVPMCDVSRQRNHHLCTATQRPGLHRRPANLGLRQPHALVGPT